MEPMKVLSLHQPWASLVALGVKTIETRSWSTSYRGPLAIHAAARPVTPGAQVGDFATIGDADLPRDTPPFLVKWPKGQSLDRHEPWRYMPLGAVVATCTLADCVPIERERDVPITYPGYQRSARSRVIDFPKPSGIAAAGLWLIGTNPITHGSPTPIEDQRPYGDFTPGRFAWLLADIVRLEDPVPFKGGQGLSRTWDPTGAAA